MFLPGREAEHLRKRSMSKNLGVGEHSWVWASSVVDVQEKTGTNDGLLLVTVEGFKAIEKTNHGRPGHTKSVQGIISKDFRDAHYMTSISRYSNSATSF